MKTRFLHIVALIFICAATSQLISQDDFPSDWIDPGDMEKWINPEEPGNSRETENEEKSEEENVEKSEAENVEKLEAENVEKSEEENEYGIDPEGGDEIIGRASQSIEDISTPSQTCKHPMLKRYISVLHGRLEAAGEPHPVQRYELYLKVDNKMRQALQEYGASCQRNVLDIIEVLENMIDDVRLHVDVKVPWKRKFEDYINMHFDDFLKLAGGVLIVFLILTLEVISRVSWASQVKRLFVLGFIVSIAMTYIQEVKKAEAEFEAKSKNIPTDCLNDFKQISYLSSFKMMYDDFFSVKNADDRCQEYHEVFLVHPKLKITPTKVIAVTFANFALEPLEHIGTSFSKAFKKIFAGLPVTLWIPAFVFVIIAILGFMLIVAVLFGYNFSVNLPFWTGLQIMPPQPNFHHHPEVDQLRDENMRLHNRIEDLRDIRQQALPPAPAHPPERTYGYDIPPHPPTSQRSPENLPYPDLGPDTVGGGDFHHGRYYEQSEGLRRRHTYSADIGSASGDATLPYPTSEEEDHHPVNRSARSTSNPAARREGIGFEPLVRAQMDEDSQGFRKHKTGTESTYGKMEKGKSPPAISETPTICERSPRGNQTANKPIDISTIGKMTVKGTPEKSSKDNQITDKPIENSTVCGKTVTNDDMKGTPDKSSKDNQITDKPIETTVKDGDPKGIPENVGHADYIGVSNDWVEVNTTETEQIFAEDNVHSCADPSLNQLEREAATGFSFDSK